jgi:hypothetical protein
LSTTIDVFPATDFMPLVEQTRARTQELFQELLDRRGIASLIEVKAFHPSADSGPIRYVADDLRWQAGLDIGFGYWVKGEWVSSSWPSCLAVEEDDFITAEDTVWPFQRAAEFIGCRTIIDEFKDVIPEPKLGQVLRQDHYWYEYRNMGGPAIASTGYGLVATALAEATEGIIASFDSAFDIEHNGETAEQFLAWWGDQQIDFYGPQRFLAART